MLNVIYVKRASLFSCRLCWKKPVVPCTSRRLNRESSTGDLFSQSKTDLSVFLVLYITCWAEKKKNTFILFCNVVFLLNLSFYSWQCKVKPRGSHVSWGKPVLKTWWCPLLFPAHPFCFFTSIFCCSLLPFSSIFVIPLNRHWQI